MLHPRVCLVVVLAYAGAALQPWHGAPAPMRLAVPHNVSAAADAILRQSCGSACLEVLADFLAALGNTSLPSSVGELKEAWAPALQVMGARAARQVETALGLVAALERRAVHSRSNTGVMFAKPDTACATPTACTLKSLVANKCNYGRAALQMTYQSINVVVGALAGRARGMPHHIRHWGM
uniref:Pectinesterase inhibitor domain-containing protein n=1 Tax=Alexandrium monilatum TaxID=311494 RepID=A0A7S4TAN0_9DINO